MAKKVSFSIKPYVVKKLITCYKDQSINDACSLMAKNDIGTIIIIERKNKKKCLGIFTESDLVKKVISKKISLDEILEKVMSKKIVTANMDSSDAFVSYLMTKNKVKKLIILKDSKLCGIITQSDMMKLLSQEWLK